MEAATDDMQVYGLFVLQQNFIKKKKKKAVYQIEPVCLSAVTGSEPKGLGSPLGFFLGW